MIPSSVSSSPCVGTDADRGGNSQAYATREDFSSQRTILASIDSRMGGVLSQMPGINSLITMIRTRRRRDTIIVGVVIGGCMLLLLGYMFGF
jgi:Golgi SNAP receptor complex protein 1